MTTRVKYPDLNEDLVRTIQDMLSHRPQWFDMGHWGIVGDDQMEDGQIATLKLPGAKSLLKDYIEPNYCDTALCLAGTACLLNKTAAWWGHVNGEWKELRPGKVRAASVELRAVDEEGQAVDFAVAGANALGLTWSQANSLFLSGCWPNWIYQFEYHRGLTVPESQRAAILLQCLLDDQEWLNPDVEWLEAQRASLDALVSA